MRVGIFGAPGHETEAAIAEGLRSLGASITFQKTVVWEESQAVPFSLVVVRGLRLASGTVRDYYRSRGVPVLIHDLPAIRKPGYFSLWRDDVNTLPVVADESRLAMVDLAEHRNGGNKILLCGQKAGDASHGKTRQQLEDYFGTVSVALASQYNDCEVVWRPHPQENLDLYWFKTQSPSAIRFEDALADPNLFAVATLNSTCGIAALEAGVPVLCHPDSFYASLAGVPTPRGLRRQFFARLTHTQWTLDELRTAEPYIFNLPAEVAA